MKIPKPFRWKPTGHSLGQGAQARVVVVTDETQEFEGNYALKGLAQGRPRQAYERFSREIKAIKRLNHPTIIKVFDHSEPDDAFQFYVMEFIEGARPLKKLLGTEDNPFYGDPAKSLKLFKRLVEAIGEFAKVQIVHRDLSPANLLVLPNEDIKVIDFGICYEADGQLLTLVDEGVGSRNYTAPECESGGGGPVTVAADMYSAGKILWSAVTNKMAFARESPAFTDKAMSQQVADPRLWHLHHIFARTIRHDLGDRFGDAAQAFNTVTRVERLLSFGHPPLERFADRQICPICGWGQLTSFDQSHMVFGNPNPAGIGSFRCTYCGCCFAIDVNIVRSNLEKNSRLS